jgi:5-methyltetrahydrofolate--homocysteine methyltransferase
MDPAVVYGYFPVVSEGHDVIVLHHGTDDGGALGTPGNTRA